MATHGEEQADWGCETKVYFYESNIYFSLMLNWRQDLHTFSAHESY